MNVAVIGYGYWGPNLARNFMEAEGCELRAVCDAREERLALAARRHPSARLARSPREVFSDSRIDAVAIATPVASHFALALEALEAGKHVLAEKPLALTSREADRLIEAAGKAKRVLMVDHTFVYTGAVREIKRLLDAGELGEIYYYDSVRINLGLFQHDVNVLWDLAVHDLAILDYLLGGRVIGVSAQGLAHFKDRPENIAYLTLLLEGNLLAHLHVNWLAPVKIRRTVIGGSRKMVVYDDLEPSEKIKVYDSGVELKDEAGVYKMLVSYRAGEMRSPKVDLTEALQTEVRHFAECVRTGAKPLTDGEAGARVIRILEAAGESMASGGSRVFPKKSASNA